MLIDSIRDPDYLEYLLRDGSRELTADWDAGAFTITTGSVVLTNSLTVKDGATVIFYVDDDELFFTADVAVDPVVGNPYGLLLLFTYPA